MAMGTAAHVPHPAGPFPAAASRKGCRGGDGTAGSHQLSTFTVLPSPVTPGSSHALSHPRPPPAKPTARSQEKSKKEEKKEKNPVSE